MDEATQELAMSLHPIGVVAERTGLSLDVLRVWERRYGVVTPGRDESGRRLYTDADIERLRLLSLATSGGRAIRQVASLPVVQLRELVREDEAARLKAPRATLRRIPEDFVELSLERTRALDGPGLDAVLRRAVSMVGVPSFLEEVVPDFAREVGDEWHAGRLSVAQEHLAMGVLRPLLASLRAALPVPPGAPGLVVATPAGERHEVGALLVAGAAAAEGWHVTYLGADVPTAEIARAAQESGARAVALSVLLVTDALGLSAELRGLRSLLPADMSILVGGGGQSQLAEHLQEPSVLQLAGLPELRAHLRWATNAGRA